MFLKELNIKNFRHLSHLSPLSFHPHLNFINGENGSGKSALLEAIFYLGRGKSFRENQTRHIIADNQLEFQLTAKINHQAQSHFLGIARNPKKIQIRLDGKDLNSLSDLAQLLPIQMINADHFALISAGPENRRQFMDYSLFYRESDFLFTWRKYQYALKNRNAALKHHWQNHHFKAWHQTLSETANIISNYRETHLQQLESKLNYYHMQLGGLDALNIRYYCGWNKETDLEQLLEQHLERDKQLKHTKDGIHRSEWRILNQHHDIAHHYSRGQQKTVICALMLAQADLIAEAIGKRPLILIDDISAELDENRRDLLMNLLIQSGGQLFISNITAFSNENNAQQYRLVNGEIQSC